MTDKFRNPAKMKIKGLQALEDQYCFIAILESCGDAKDAPQYYEGQVNQLMGMTAMYDAIFGDAPYNRAATKAKLEELRNA